MPLQVGGACNGECGIEIRQGARVVGQPHRAGASPADHHQVLRFIAFVADAARQIEGARERRNRGGRFGVGKMRLPPAMKSLHSDQIGQRQAFADLHRLLVMTDRQIVSAIAPGHRPQVIQRIGRMPFITHGARCLQCFVQAGNGLLVRVGAPQGHAKLNQGIPRLAVLAQRPRGINHASEVGHRALDLAGLCARLAALLVERELLRRVCRFGMGLQQGHRAIKPLQRFPHGK